MTHRPNPQAPVREDDLCVLCFDRPKDAPIVGWDDVCTLCWESIEEENEAAKNRAFHRQERSE